MPTLKQITCAIELGPGNTRLKEYGHKITDGAVEAYIVAPDSEIPFHVHITSEGYIAPGLSAYVFTDGEYQCNRNRLRLRLPEDGVSTDEYQIDLKLRQKEEKTSDGTFIARDWTFTPLGTGIADKAPNLKNFKDNVGTIEVVILRCKDGGGKELSTDPAQTTVSRNPSYAVRAPSARAPSVRAPSVRVTPTRAPSTVKSSNKSLLGGMMDIFDGAGDEPGYYKQYRPRNIVGQEHLPGHKWDTSSGQYRYSNDQDPFVDQREQADSRYAGSFSADRYRPETYTVGGGFSYQESVWSQDEPTEKPKVFVPQTSPGYDFNARRRKPPRRDTVEHTKSTYDFSRSRKQNVEHRHQHTQRTAPRSQQTSEHSAQPEDTPEQHAQPEQKGSGLAFVEEAGQLIKQEVHRFNFEVDKYAALKEDAKRYSNRRVIYLEIIKASHRKYGEIVEIMKDLGHLYGIVKQTMDDMDRETWRRASDLLYDMELYPPPAFEVEPPQGYDEEGRPEAPPSLAGAKEDPDAGWGFEQVGEGTAGEKPHVQGLRQVWEDSSPSKKEGSKASWGGSKDRKKEKSTTEWAQPDPVPVKEDSGWGNDNGKDSKGKSTSGQTTTSDKMPGAWDDTDDNKAGNDGWGNIEEAAKKKKKEDGRTAPAWDNAETPKAKSGKADQGWGGDAGRKPRDGSRHGRTSQAPTHRTGPANDGARSDYYTLGDPRPKPVIKPYWSEWTSKPVTVKPKVQPREVYEYPALPLPALPGGKADKGITQAVHAGRGANYAHKLYRPEYLDTMSKPYAVFTFKYRSKAALEAILKQKISDTEIREARVEAKKHSLLGKSKDELVEELMKRTSIAAQSKAPSKAATGKHDDWGATNEKAASVKGSSSHRVSQSKSQVNDAWDSNKTVHPSDSVSQSGAKQPSGTAGRGHGGGTNVDNSWPKESSRRANTNPPASRHSTKVGGNSADQWNEAGWGPAVKPPSAHTAEHFPGAEVTGKTSGKKGFIGKW